MVLSSLCPPSRSSHLSSARAVPPRVSVCRIVALALLLTLATAGESHAKSSSWSDGTGGTFKGEPVEVLGPFALFRRGATAGQTVPLGRLSREECIQFFEQTKERAARADDWTAATGAATKALTGHVDRLDDGKLVAADLASRPEPALLVVLYASAGDGPSWELLGNFQPTYLRIQRTYPGLLEAVFFGVRHDEAAHRSMAMTMNVPWLVADFRAQRSMSALSRLAPGTDRRIVMMNRDGVPLLVSEARDVQDLARFVDMLSDFIRAIDPDNATTLPDRHHYVTATRPVQFSAGSAGPLLIGHLLDARVLREHGVKQVNATLETAADGRVTSPRLHPADDIPAALVQPLEQAIQQSAVISPAIDRGRPVAGRLEFGIDVSKAPQHAPDDAVWKRPTKPGDLALRDWLLLRPIPVPESSFSNVDHVAEDGTVVMTELRASTGSIGQARQKSAFHANWFDAAGADAVQPRAGDRQEVDGIELTWEAVESKDGLVDFQRGKQRNYCIGYAWTEIDMPAETLTWLGLGSDDGVKLWLNGELILDKWIRRPSRLDDDIVPMRLRAGKNRILIKIQNMTDHWSFIARLRAYR